MKRLIAFAVLAAALLSYSILCAVDPDRYLPSFSSTEGVTVAPEKSDFVFTAVTEGEETYLSLTEYTGSEWFVNIPATVDGVPVRKIGDAAFYRNRTVRAVLLPNTLTEIGSYAFADSNVSIVIPGEGLRIIDYAAFHGCDELRVFDLQHATELLQIGDFAFAECTALISDLAMPDSLLLIGGYAFQGCASAPSLTLNEGLVYIGDGAFNHCIGLQNESIHIPASVRQIGGAKFAPGSAVRGTHVFYNCAPTTLSSFTVGDGSLAYIARDGVLYAQNEAGEPAVLVCYPPNRAGATYELPSGVSDAYELSFGRPLYLRELILSDAFTVYTELPDNYLNTGSNLSVAIYNKNALTSVSCTEGSAVYATRDGMLLTHDMKTLLYAPLGAGRDDVLSIPDGVERIEDGAICTTESKPQGNRYAAKRIVIPDSLSSVSDGVLAAINAQPWQIVLSPAHGTLSLSDGKLVRK